MSHLFEKTESLVPSTVSELKLKHTDSGDTHRNHHGLVNGDILKYYYAGTLKVLPPQVVGPFWTEIYNVHFCSDFSRHEYFNHIWSGNLVSALEIVIDITNRLDNFLFQNDIDSLDFVKNVLPEINKGTFVSSLNLLLLSSPYLKALFCASDLRETLLKFYDKGAEKIVGGIVHKLIHHEVDAQKATACMLYCSPFKNSSPEVYKKLNCYDFEAWTIAFLQQTPKIFGFQPYEEYRMICDCRKFDYFFDRARIKTVGSDVLIDGEYFGTAIKLFDQCAKYREQLQTMDISDGVVIRAEKDHFCPRKKRVVVHKGCCYGAPVFLYVIKYLYGSIRSEDFLTDLISSVQEESSLCWSNLKLQHEKILSTRRPSLNVVYNRQAESIIINKVHFITNVPARIFSKILSDYKSQGKCNFEHRDFTKDLSVIDDPVNPNFVVRLKRLIDAVARNCPEIKIEKTGRGKFKIEISCELNYEEIE